MAELSVLIAGKAGDGINQAGFLLAKLLGALGYRTYMYFDYASLIRGGHNFSVVRASERRIAAHRDSVDFLLALDHESVATHRWRLKNPANIIYDSDVVRPDPAVTVGLGLPLKKILSEEGARPVMRNSCMIGAFAQAVGIEWEIVEQVFRKSGAKALDMNLKLAAVGYREAEKTRGGGEGTELGTDQEGGSHVQGDSATNKDVTKLAPLKEVPLPVLTGNEALAAGLIAAGLRAYIAYPMTPSSSALHFLADAADEFSLKVIHPENEIAVMLMALGFSYAGERVAVGTSGGGFCLMTEGLSLAGMAELPIVVFVGQRPGPSTGLPTYTAQGELQFVLNAGHGEFVRFVVAPGDAEEAYYWSAVALNVAWEYQIPSIILSDKTLSEGGFNFDSTLVKAPGFEEPSLWDDRGSYMRYKETVTGVSPLAFPPRRGAVVKVNSYEHGEDGITTEDARETVRAYEKRLRKGTHLMKELEGYEAVKVHARTDSDAALLCWGSNKGVCVEVGENLGMRVIQPVVLSPFPVKQFTTALRGVKRLVAVENNATGQIARLVKAHGFDVDARISKYDGRPFSLDELDARLNESVRRA